MITYLLSLFHISFVIQGAFNRNQKILNFYGEFLHLPNHLINHTNTIFLIATGNTKTVEYFGIDFIVEKISQEINLANDKLASKDANSKMPTSAVIHQYQTTLPVSMMGQDQQHFPVEDAMLINQKLWICVSTVTAD